MKIKILILISIAIAAVYSQAVAWRGVSDLGGRGVGIVTGSQVVGPNGFSSQSSSSFQSIGGNSNRYPSTPVTTL
jgi:hypothetical protein